MTRLAAMRNDTTDHSGTDMNRTIEHKPERHRFECTEESMTGTLDYELADDVMTITHTNVPSALEGRGIAGDLTRNALETARNNGWKVRPACSYARAYINRHREYQDLLA